MSLTIVFAINCLQLELLLVYNSLLMCTTVFSVTLLNTVYKLYLFTICRLLINSPNLSMLICLLICSTSHNYPKDQATRIQILNFLWLELEANSAGHFSQENHFPKGTLWLACMLVSSSTFKKVNKWKLGMILMQDCKP